MARDRVGSDLISLRPLISLDPTFETPLAAPKCDDAEAREDAEGEGARARDEQVGARAAGHARARAARRLADEPEPAAGVAGASPARRHAPPTMVEIEIEVPTRLDAPVRAQVDVDCTVLEVKRRVEATEGLLAAHQRVVLGGLSLEDGRSLRAYGVGDGARLRVLSALFFEPPEAFDALEPPPLVDARARASARRSALAQTRRRAAAALRATPGAPRAAPRPPPRSPAAARPGAAAGGGGAGGSVAGAGARAAACAAARAPRAPRAAPRAVVDRRPPCSSTCACARTSAWAR